MIFTHAVARVTVNLKLLPQTVNVSTPVCLELLPLDVVVACTPSPRLQDSSTAPVSPRLQDDSLEPGLNPEQRKAAPMAPRPGYVLRRPNESQYPYGG